MALAKHIRKPERSEIRVTLDSRKRVNLAKLLTDSHTVSFKAYTQGDKIILEPMVEIPARELWLYENREALKTVKEGIQQSKDGKVRTRKSYAEHVDDEV